MPSIALRLATLALLLLAAVPASASASLTASDVRIGSQPASVRVVVDFRGGPIALNEVQSTDPNPADGRSVVEIRGRGIRVPSFDRRAHGVRVRAGLAGAGRGRITLTSDRTRLKYVRVSALREPERLVIDLYRSAPPTDEAEIRTDRTRCLTMTSVARSADRFRVRGTELNLFEGNFLLRVRDARGRVVGRRVVTARGRWAQTVSYSVSRAQAGTVEAVASSAKDGSLVCLVQVRVTLVA